MFVLIVLENRMVFLGIRLMVDCSELSVSLCIF